MELWIRSQDKETLRLAEMLDIYDLSDDEGLCWVIEESGTDIGHYKSKKRAVEVLDEIQRILRPTLFLSGEISSDNNNWVENGIIYQKYKDNYSIQELSSYVYEMPKE